MADNAYQMTGKDRICSVAAAVGPCPSDAGGSLPTGKRPLTAQQVTAHSFLLSFSANATFRERRR